MGLGLGTRLGEYKDPETQSHHIRRSLTSARKWSGYAIEFFNTADRFYKATDITLGATVDEYTITLRFKADNVTNTRCLCSISGNVVSSFPLMTIYIHDSKLAIAGSSGHTVLSTNLVGKTSDSSISTGTWYHVVATFNLATGNQSCVLWLNGAKQTSSADGNAVWFEKGQHALGVTSYQEGDGEDTNITDVYYDGVMSHVAFWSGESFANNKVQALYFNGRPRSAENISRSYLRRHWPATKQGINDGAFDPNIWDNIHVIDNGAENTKWETGNTVAGYGLQGFGYSAPEYISAAVAEYFNE